MKCHATLTRARPHRFRAKGSSEVKSIGRETEAEDALQPTDREIGARIRAARTARGWTHEELAARVGVNWRTVHRWQNGQLPKLEVLRQLAEILGVPPSYLLGATGEAAGIAEVERQLRELTARVERLSRIVEDLADRDSETEKRLQVRDP